MNKTIVPMDSVNKKIFERIRQVHKGKEFHTVEDLEELVQIPLDIAEAELSRCALTTAGLILKNYTFGHMMKKINRYPPQMFETPSPLVLLLDLEEGETRKFNFLGITCRYLSGLLSKKLEDIERRKYLLEFMELEISKHITLDVWPNGSLYSGYILAPSTNPSLYVIRYAPLEDSDGTLALVSLEHDFSSVEEAAVSLEKESTLIFANNTENYPFLETSFIIIQKKLSESLEPYQSTNLVPIVTQRQ